MFCAENTLVHGEKTIKLPFACQDKLVRQMIVKTTHNEVFLFLELRSLQQKIKDNKFSYDHCVVDGSRNIHRRKYHKRE